MRRLILGGAAVALMLAGCDSPTSAVETRDRGPATTEATMTAAAAPATAVEAPAEAPGAMTSNRSESVDEKVRRLFERNGADFGARTPEAYLAQVESIDLSMTGSAATPSEMLHLHSKDLNWVPPQATPLFPLKSKPPSAH